MTPREVLIKYGQSCYQGFNDPETALSDLSEIVTGICKEESFKWKDVKADNKFGVGVRAGIEAIEFRLSELFTAKEHTKKGETQ